MYWYRIRYNVSLLLMTFDTFEIVSMSSRFAFKDAVISITCNDKQEAP